MLTTPIVEKNAKFCFLLYYVSHLNVSLWKNDWHANEKDHNSFSLLTSQSKRTHEPRLLHSLFLHFSVLLRFNDSIFIAGIFCYRIGFNYFLTYGKTEISFFCQKNILFLLTEKVTKNFGHYSATFWTKKVLEFHVLCLHSVICILCATVCFGFFV